MHFTISCLNHNFAPFKQICFSFKVSRAFVVCKNCLSLSIRMKCIHAFNNEGRLDLDYQANCGNQIAMQIINRQWCNLYSQYIIYVIILYPTFRPV